MPLTAGGQSPPRLKFCKGFRTEPAGQSRSLAPRAKTKSTPSIPTIALPRVVIEETAVGNALEPCERLPQKFLWRDLKTARNL